MPSTRPAQRQRRRRAWTAVRQPLSPRAATVLTAASFLLPLALWCVVSYVPFIWHPDVRLQIAALREDSSTIYTPGDHLSREFFAEYADAIRAENDALRAARERDAVEALPAGAQRRANLKTLRHLAPVGLANGWLTDETETDDQAIYDLWKGIATGELESTEVDLSPENRAVIEDNWQRLAAISPDEYSFNKLPTEPLLKLVPQGYATNPDYLPPPHRVLTTGFADWTREPENDKPTMGQRMAQSVKIVFGGFLLSCLIGIPIGIICGTYSFVSKLFEPFIDFFRYMPAPAFGTLLVAVFLAHDAPKIALVFIGTVFQMVLVIAKTTRQLDYGLIEAAQTLGANNRRLLTRVVIPGILPDMYNDLRILLGWAWTWLVIAELIGVKSGLTEFIETQGRWRNFDRVFPVIIMIGLLGFFTDQVLIFVRRFLFPYQYSRASRVRGWLGRLMEPVLVRFRPVAPSDPRRAPAGASSNSRSEAADVAPD